MAYLHQPGWTAPNGRQIKSVRTAIDEEMLQLFKSVVAEKAAVYERCYVAELGKRLADEIKASRRLESLRRLLYGFRCVPATQAGGQIENQ